MNKKTAFHTKISSKSSTSNATLCRLIVPQILMMFFQFSIGFTDVWTGGQIHQDVQASIGIIVRCQYFFLVVAMALANGAVAAISQSLGARLQSRARRYVGLLLTSGLVFSALVLALGTLFKGAALHALQVPAEILPMVSVFWDVYLWTLPAYYMWVIGNAVFRAYQLVMLPLFSSAVIAAINAVADFGLGLGWFSMPCLGGSGVAWASFYSVMAGAGVNLFFLFYMKLARKKSFAPWKWIRRALPYLLRVALPSGAMQGLWQIGYLVLIIVVSSLPNGNLNALSGMAAGMNIEAILFLPAFAFNMTASILVGNNLGAGNVEEAKRVGIKLTLLAITSLSLLAVPVWIFVDEICYFVAPEPNVQAQAVLYLTYNIIAIPFTVGTMTMAGILNGAGAVKYNFLISSSSIWGIRLPVAYVLGHYVWGTAEGVYFAMMASQCYQCTLLAWIVLCRNWQRFSMMNHRTSHKAAREKTV